MSKFPSPFAAVALSLSLGGGLALGGCGQKPADDPRLAEPLVRTLVVGRSQDVGDVLTGVVHARFETDLAFRAGGKIAERLVDPGVHVRKGQVLMQLDPSDYALAASAADAQYLAAKAQADRAASDEKRLRGLVQSGAISAQTYDQAAAAAKSADEQARAALAQRDVARRQSGFTNLEADADGVVMSLSVEVGQVVAAGQPVLRLARDGEREAVVSAPEGLRGRLAHQATAIFPGVTDAAVPAALRQLSQAADPLTRTYEARYTLSGAGAAAPLGGTVSVRLPRTGRQQGIEAPLSAVVDRGEGAYVLVLPPGQSVLRKRPVQVESLTEETAVITSGLASGEQIVALGAALLHDGQHVRVESRK